MLEAAREDLEQQEFTANARTARFMALLANIYRSAEKHPEYYKPADFMPNYKPPEKEQTPEEQLAMIELAHTAFRGGK